MSLKAKLCHSKQKVIINKWFGYSENCHCSRGVTVSNEACIELPPRNHPKPQVALPTRGTRQNVTHKYNSIMSNNGCHNFATNTDEKIEVAQTWHKFH